MGAFNATPTDLNEGYLWKLIDALEAQSLTDFFDTLAVFFADIPYDLPIAKEKYYQTIFYLVFRMLGVLTEVEVETNDGRIDAVVISTDQIYLFEFKLDKSADEALQQMLEKQYADKYRLR